MKWLLRIGLIVVLLVVVVAVAAFILIDNIATAAVKNGAAYATQTDVEVEAVDISIVGASATITNLDIKNPDGPFREKFDSFLKLGDASAEVTAGSVMSELIEIPEITLSNIEISLVSFDDGKKNYEVILESLKRFQGDEPPKETESEKQVVIKKLIIKNITVKYDFAKDPALGAVPAKGTITIADDEPMVLTDVGSGGVPMSQITADIITDILIQVTANMGSQIGDHILGLTGSLADTVGLDKLNSTLQELDLDLDVGKQLNKLKDLGVDIGGGAGDIIKGAAKDIIGGGLNDVFGGDKDKDKDKESEEEEEEGVLEGLNPF
ncbi:MAG: hypothetical protein KTR15_04360 [Phycisphaeraceae bacterium]|nr:hypothetical protein [Phycisphaeraceae bacterium]